MAVDLVDCVGSTVTDFMQDAGTKFGTGSLGKTTPSVSYAYDDDGKNKLAKVTLTLSTVSRTAHWAGSGMKDGKPALAPDAANKSAIDRVEAMNKAHEQRHIDTYQTTFDAQKDAVQNRAVGKPISGASAAKDEMLALLLSACEDLHKTEGDMDVTRQGDAFRVVPKPRGPGGCA
jgi:hypothetical protein